MKVLEAPAEPPVGTFVDVYIEQRVDRRGGTYVRVGDGTRGWVHIDRLLFASAADDDGHGRSWQELCTEAVGGAGFVEVVNESADWTSCVSCGSSLTALQMRAMVQEVLARTRARHG